MLENPIVFIAGCPRSGTTWMGHILQQHPRVVYSMESAILDVLTGVWWDRFRPPWLLRLPREIVLGALETALVRRRPRWYRDWRRGLISYFDSRWAFIQRHSGLKEAETLFSRYRERVIGYERLVELIDELERNGRGLGREEKRRRLANAIFADFLERHGGGPESILVEKSPRHLLAGEFILDAFPQAKILEMLRDGRDVCASMEAYTERMPQQRSQQLFLWKMYAEKGLALKRNPAYRDRILTVRFEDLRRDTPAEIRRVFDFLNVPLKAGDPEAYARATRLATMKKIEGGKHFGEGKHYRKGTVGDWRNRFSDEDVELFRETIGELFERRGYAW